MAKKYLERNVNQVITWSRNQIKDPTQDWTGLCQSHCRHAYGVPAWAGSAIIAWNKIPRSAEAPVGAPLGRATRRTPLLRHRPVRACSDRDREAHELQLPVERLRPQGHDRRLFAGVPEVGR